MDLATEYTDYAEQKTQLFRVLRVIRGRFGDRRLPEFRQWQDVRGGFPAGTDFPSIHLKPLRAAPE